MKPIDERLRDTYVRIEHTYIEKPQSSIKENNTKYPDYNKALVIWKDKFITNMKNLFKTRANYRICLSLNADYAIMKTDLKSRIGTDDIEKSNRAGLTLAKVCDYLPT